jgi:hypothetical protein
MLELGDLKQPAIVQVQFFCRECVSRARRLVFRRPYAMVVKLPSLATPSSIIWRLPMGRPGGLALRYWVSCSHAMFVCLFGGVSKVGEIRTLPKTSLPVAVLRVAKGRIPFFVFFASYHAVLVAPPPRN